jgi:energy-coupling factor transport system ATP-binding protein
VHFQNGDKPKPGLDVAMLFQNPTDQLFTDSVDEEVGFGPHNYQCFDCDTHLQILGEADLLHLRKRRPLMLSVGQQQRTALSACLGLRPRLLILDEPTLGQDWGHLQRLMDFLRFLNRQGTAILLISHDYKLVHRYAHRVFMIKNGRIHLAGQFDQSRTSRSELFADIQEGVTYETLNT